MEAVNTLDVALARRARQAEWMREVAAVDAQERPKPKPKPVAKSAGGRPTTHGHYKAYLRHIHAGETPCPPCEKARERHNEKCQERNARRKKRAMANG